VFGRATSLDWWAHVVVSVSTAHTPLYAQPYAPHRKNPEVMYLFGKSQSTTLGKFSERSVRMRHKLQHAYNGGGDRRQAKRRPVLAGEALEVLLRSAGKMTVPDLSAMMPAMCSMSL